MTLPCRNMFLSRQLYQKSKHKVTALMKSIVKGQSGESHCGRHNLSLLHYHINIQFNISYFLLAYDYLYCLFQSQIIKYCPLLQLLKDLPSPFIRAADTLIGLSSASLPHTCVTGKGHVLKHCNHFLNNCL